MITTADFRDAIEQLYEYETNPISRFRIRRAMRNGRVMDRWRERVITHAVRSGIPIAALRNPLGAEAEFDFQALLDWFIENWDEILKLLLTILPFFI